MNGPQRYRRAERLIANATSAADAESASLYLAEAQVHATLALAAATVDVATVDDARIVRVAWKEAMSS